MSTRVFPGILRLVGTAVLSLGMAAMSPLACHRSARADDFAPPQDRLPFEAPAGAVVLLGPGIAPRFRAMDGGPADWKRDGDELIVTPSEGHANHIHSIDTFQDADLHAEFVVDPLAHGNSGLYFHGWFEMQIYDSAGIDPVTDQDEGSLYRFAQPLLNAARPAGQWQVYDIRYTAPRRGADGKVTRPGSIIAWLNGKKVQDGVEFDEPRSPYIRTNMASPTTSARSRRHSSRPAAGRSSSRITAARRASATSGL